MSLALSWDRFGYFLFFARRRELILQQADLHYKQLVFIL